MILVFKTTMGALNRQKPRLSDLKTTHIFYSQSQCTSAANNEIHYVCCIIHLQFDNVDLLTHTIVKLK
jgi:hypothetical protein